MSLGKLRCFLLWFFVLTAALTMLSARSFALSSDSITVTAVVPGVREVLLDQSGGITTVRSNTKENIAPVFYKTSLESEPISPSAKTLKQYRKLLATLDTDRTGTIYQSKPPANAPAPLPVTLNITKLSL